MPRAAIQASEPLSGISVENEAWLTCSIPKTAALAEWTLRRRQMTRAEYDKARKPLKLKSGRIIIAAPVEPDGETPELR